MDDVKSLKLAKDHCSIAFEELLKIISVLDPGYRITLKRRSTAKKNALLAQQKVAATINIINAMLVQKQNEGPS